MPAAPMYRYEEVASFITSLVDNGTLVVGSRAPSLRQISRQRHTSVTTALQAYRLLEDRGILEARPQSGFYVAGGGAPSLPAPASSRPPVEALPVAVSGVVLELLEYAADPNLVPLGCAIPGPEVLNAAPLDRFLARAARRQGAAYNVYTHPQGDPRLRQEIARRALRWGQALSPDAVVITAGCTEALNLALRAVTRPGDTVAIESPTYFGLLHTLEELELKALELPTDPTDGIEVGALQRALDSRRIAACLFASSFNNPLGCTMPDDKKDMIVQLLDNYGVPLIEDDIYGDIYFGPRRPTPFMAFDRPSTALYCSSFSKTIAPGYRIGWLVAQRGMQRIIESKLTQTLCAPALLQAALADLLSSGGYDSHLRRIRRVFQDTIEHMTRAIDRSFPPGTRVTRPSGGFVLWLELPAPLRSRALLERALADNICFVPGDVFSASDRFARYLRLSCGHRWNARLELAVTRLGALAWCALAAGQP